MSQPLRDQLQSTLGDSYTIERELGGGGMSQVFVAEDKTLARRIVVKVLPVETRAEVSIERFKREIQIAARLQHPHIVPVLSAGEIQGLPYYTMPFVKGESLRARLARGGELSVNETIHYLRDVAAALAYAHAEGVVHRDIKPDNVIVSGGVAVVTDFGVSKAVDVAVTEGDGPSTGITSLGVALGTPAYMSPEQASADPRVDHRADIYSFGCLAYELLAGASPFGGRPPQQMLAAHVSESPEPLLKRRPHIPPALAALVMRCLEKRPGDRPQSADELLAALDGISTPSGGMTPTGGRLPAAGMRQMLWPLGIVALLSVLGAAAFIWRTGQRTMTYAVGATTPIAVTPELEFGPAVSPDGKVVAFSAITPNGTKIFVRQIDGGRATMISGDLDGNHGAPSWSSDGSRISFIGKGSIYTVPSLTGGSPKRMVPRAISYSWSRDGRQIVFADSAGISLYDVNSGATRRVRSGSFLRSPAVSPDGRMLVYAEGRQPTFTNVSAGSIWVVPMAGGTPHRISDSTHVNLSPVWTPDGRSVLYLSNSGGTRDVYQQPLRRTGEPEGAPIRLTTALGSFNISLSFDGSRLAYDVIRNNSNIFEVDIGPAVAPLSAGRQITSEGQHIESLELSHDGKWLAYDSDRNGSADLYKMRLDGTEAVQLTTSPAGDFAPAWSPDDRWLAFHSNRTGSRDIFVISSEGTEEQRVTRSPAQDFYPHWAPNGSSIVYEEESGSDLDYQIIERRNGKWAAPRRLAHAQMTQAGSGRWSPSGKLVAIITGSDVAVLPPGGTQKIVASRETLKGRPLWLEWGADDEMLFAFAGDMNGNGAIWQIPLDGRAPRPVVASGSSEHFGRWEFTTDGKRIFFTRGEWQSDVWVMDLKR